jgi:hypothetical protein
MEEPFSGTQHSSSEKNGQRTNRKGSLRAILIERFTGRKLGSTERVGHRIYCQAATAYLCVHLTILGTMTRMNASAYG